MLLFSFFCKRKQPFMAVYPVTHFVCAEPGFHHSPLLSIPHLVSLTWAKSEPLPPLDVSESLNELRDMICSYYEDSSLSVCCLPLFLPASAIQNGFGFVVSTGCLACEPLEAGHLELLLPRPHEPHLGVPPLCAHISLLFTPANPDPGHFLLP